MRILLVYPNCLEDRLHAEDVRVVPIGLYYIGALLKRHSYDVDIVNWHDIHRTPEKIVQTFKEKRPDVIGFSIVHANRWGAIDIARCAKKILPRVNIVFGGPGTTFLWEHLLNSHKEIDFAVLGEGEYSFLDLVRCIEKKEFYRLKEIKGIAFRSSESIIKTREQDMIKNLDELPMPSQYFTFQHLSSSRGCPANCTFCSSPLFWGRKVRFHSPEYFVTQLKQLYDKGITFFYISDDTFTMQKTRVTEICKKIVESNLQITWFAISRVNYVDEEMLLWMRKAGCIQISYGVESGSEKIRSLLNKNIKRDDIKRAFALTTRYGILARAYFIYGCPGETAKTIQETMDLIHEIKPLSIIFYILDIFPGTALYEAFKKSTGLSDDIWMERIEDILYFESDSRITKEMIMDFGKSLRTYYYSHLPRFAEEVDLSDRDDLRHYHADFLSRLAMTFSHGDYAMIDAISDKELVAEHLYERALAYSPDQRAFLGLGIIRQKQGRHREAVHMLSEGIRAFPQNASLAICLGISYMNLGSYAEALRVFRKFPDSPEALQYMAACHQALGDNAG